MVDFGMIKTILSSSVEMTSVSVSQVTASIAHIAKNTTELTRQTQETIEYVERAVTTTPKNLLTNPACSRRIAAMDTLRKIARVYRKVGLKEQATEYEC